MERDEDVQLFGRHFTFRFTAHSEIRRVEVVILEGTGAAARPYVRAAVRGRTRDDARERAWDVLRRHAGLDRYLGLVARVAGSLAPGSGLEVQEDARLIRVELTGSRRLRFPLSLDREDALDAERSDEELLAFIRAHLEAYLEPAGSSL